MIPGVRVKPGMTEKKDPGYILFVMPDYDKPAPYLIRGHPAQYVMPDPIRHPVLFSWIPACAGMTEEF